MVEPRLLFCLALRVGFFFEVLQRVRKLVDGPSFFDLTQATKACFNDNKDAAFDLLTG